MKEKWRKINGADERYEVSNTGKIRSLNYKNSGLIKELKPAKDKKGYLRTSILMQNGKYKTIKVHREIAKAFIPNPNNLPQVNHNDGNKENNTVSNLEWSTNIDNAHHAIEHGLFKNSFLATKKANEERKKPIVATKDDVSILFDSINEASRELKLNRRQIQNVLKHDRNTCGGYTFVYAKRG